MNTQNQISTFTFAGQNTVRTLADDKGEYWFLANDVCGILGYANSRDTVAKHCKPKGVVKHYTPVCDVAKRDTTSTARKSQEMTYINEPNLYRLIIKSRKPEAEAFEEWVMEEVLPTIRKTGSYSIQEQAQLPSANPYALTEQDERNLRMPLASYTCKLAGWLAKSKGVPKSQIELQLVEQFGQKHEPFFKQSKWFYSRTAEWLQEELDKLPVVDFGVSRSDLLNIFKRQCDYKQQFENWNDYQLQSWLDEQFFRNRSERYLGYPTSLESASYAQLTVLVDKMKHILAGDFNLLDMQNVQTAAPPRALLIDAADAVWDLYQFARHADVIVETVRAFLQEARPNMAMAHLDMLYDLTQNALNIDAIAVGNDLNGYLNG